MVVCSTSFCPYQPLFRGISDTTPLCRKQGTSQLKGQMSCRHSWMKCTQTWRSLGNQECHSYMKGYVFWTTIACISTAHISAEICNTSLQWCVYTFYVFLTDRFHWGTDRKWTAERGMYIMYIIYLHVCIIIFSVMPFWGAEGAPILFSVLGYYMASCS